MADIGGVIGDTFSGLFSETVGLVIWILLAVLFIGIILGIIYYFGVYKKKFDITAKIISERSGDDNRVFFDKAAIINDKKNATQFFVLFSIFILLLEEHILFHQILRTETFPLTFAMSC